MCKISDKSDKFCWIVAIYFYFVWTQYSCVGNNTSCALVYFLRDYLQLHTRHSWTLFQSFEHMIKTVTVNSHDTVVFRMTKTAWTFATMPENGKNLSIQQANCWTWTTKPSWINSSVKSAQMATNWSGRKLSKHSIKSRKLHDTGRQSEMVTDHKLI